MSEIMTKQLAQALKGYYRNEEFSDKVLHIVEMEGASKLPTNSKYNNNQDVSDKAGKSEVSHASQKNKEFITIDDEAPKKVFHGSSFFISKNITGDDMKKIESLVTKNGGSFNSTEEKTTFIISHYLLPTEQQSADVRERTIKWLEDCITENEIKSSLTNVLYRSISVETKPLSKLILTLGNCDEKEKQQLEQIAIRLGASHQDLLLTRQDNSTATVSTYFIVCSEDNTEVMQFNTASDWSIPCVSKQWLWECSKTLEKVDIKKFIIKDINNVTEKGNTTSKPVNDKAYSVFPVHSLILSFNSQYFKTLTTDSGMRETNCKDIVVKVNTGEGIYLELLIHSIYDQDVLKKLNISQLLKVLELADRFLCDTLIKIGLKVLQRLSIATVEQCNEILKQVKIFESLGSIPIHGAYKSMKDKCKVFLADYFYSLECHPEKLDQFDMLIVESLIVLLDSSFLWHENNIIHFIIRWLELDEERQTEYNIKTLLQKVRYEYTTLGYFMDILSIDHSILSKWEGFSKWYANAILYLGFSQEEQVVREINCDYENRSLEMSDTEVQSYFLKSEIVDTEIDQLVKYAVVENKKINYQGYELRPLVFIKKDTEDHSLYFTLRVNESIPREEIQSFHLKFNIAFAVFPSHITFDPSAIITTDSTESFIKHHYRRFQVELDTNGDSENHLGTVDKYLFEKFKTHGMNISVIIGGSEFVPFSWPKDLDILHHVRCYEINRKSATAFGFDDNYNDAELYTEKIEEGHYF